MFDDDKLKSLPPEKIRILYANAKAKGTPDALAIVARIEQLDLLEAPRKGMRESDLEYIEMHEIVNSSEGIRAAIAATESGMPALAGVEPLIVARLGNRYTPTNQGTINAGYIVGQMMESKGYRNAGSGNMPEGSVAKTAAKWVPRTR